MLFVNRTLALCGAILSFAVACSEPAGLPDGGPLDAPAPPVDLPPAPLDEGPPDLGPEPEEPEPWLRFERVPLEGEPEGLTQLAFVPGREDEFVLITRDGRWIHYRLEDGSARRVSSLEIPDVYVNLDCGLVSLAFAPDWPTSGHVFVGQCFSRQESGVVRAEWRPEAEDAEAAFAASRVTVLRFGSEEARFPWHNVGSIGFDADGHLWTFFGDKTVIDTAADRANPLGSMIRVRVDAAGIAHPAEGNAHESDGRYHPFVVAHGFRSPWRAAMDSRGRVLVGDVGGATYEEVSLVEPAQDHGWPAVEGPCREEEGCGESIEPLVHWNRSTRHRYLLEDPLADGIDRARVGYVGLVYEHDDDPYEGLLEDAFLFGDACVGFVRAMTLDAEGAVQDDRSVGHLVGASGWAVGPGGYLYAASFGRCTVTRDARIPAGGLWRAELDTKPARGRYLPVFPSRLSEWGLFPDAPELWNTPSEFRFFEPRHPLWTNGAGKLRHVLLPVGREPQDVDGELLWPVGTLFFKTFLFDGRPVETRVLRIREGNPAYAAYQWNDEGTDAERLDIDEPHPVPVTVDGSAFEHAIPSADQCRSCHQSGRRRVLGYTPLQLGEVAIDAPDPATRDIIGWAQGACVHCHDGSGRPNAAFSMLPADFLANTIDQPTSSSAAGAGVRVIPGDPDQSALVRAFRRMDPTFPAMPPLGVQRRDDEALARLRAWIADLDLPTDGGVPIDGGAPTDAGVSDAGAMDAGVPDAD